MKYIRIINSLILCLFVAFFSSCDVDTYDEVSLDEDIRFTLREDAVELTKANIRVRHDGSSDVTWVYLHTTDLTSDALALLKERIDNELNYTEQIVARQGNNVSLHLTGLVEKQSYRLIVSAIDQKTGELYGKVSTFVFKTRRDPDVWEINENWTLTRKDVRSQTIVTGSTDIIEYENFECNSTDGESYVVLAITADDFRSYAKDDDHKDVKRTLFEDFYADFSSQKDFKEKVLTGNGVWLEERLRSGDYVIFMIGVDEDYELSGFYRQFNMTIEKEEPSAEYEKWLGWWQVSFPNGSEPWTVYIEDLDPNMWYLSSGWEPDAVVAQVANMPVKMFFNKGDGNMQFISQEVARGDDGSIVYYYGTFPYGQSHVVLDYDNAKIADASFTNIACTEAIVEGESLYLTGVGDVTFSYGLFYILLDANTPRAASLAVPEYPWTMKKLDLDL